MDHLRDNDGTALGCFSLGTLQNLVQDCAAVHVPLREYAGHWVVPLDDMPEGGGDALEIAAVALLVSAQDPDHPEYGNIRLMFTASPVELRQWIITDGSGSETAVVLGGIKTGLKYPTATFSINADVSKRGR